MITVLSGSNSHAISHRLAKLKTKFIEQFGEAGLEVYQGDKLAPENLGGVIGGATLFATNRLIIVHSLSENKPVAERLLDMMESVSQETHLVLVEGTLDKRTALYKTLKKETNFHEFEELDDLSASKWVSERVKEAGGTISQADARLLVEYVGTDQSRLENEITKLLLFDEVISKSTISELVEKSSQDTIFQLLESALSGNTKRALTVLDGLERAHEDPFQTANMMIWQVHVLAVVASAASISDAQVAKDMKLNPFVVKKTRALVGRHSGQKTQAIINAVAELDVMLKSSAVDPWRALEHTVLSI